MSVTPAIAIGPASAPSWIHDAVIAGGAQVADFADATGIVWASPTAVDELGQVLEAHPHVEWVQLPWAGVERFVHLVDDSRLWTCGKGVYAEPVAEHALALLLAGMRNVGDYSRQRSWTGPVGRNLLGANVTILGAGGITRSLVRLLKPFNCHITVVRNMPEHFEGADVVMTGANLIDALVGADAVIVALALTPDTDGILSGAEFEQMERHAWVVNVGRGRHIVTDDLVAALRNGTIGGAALDVTDPEPLPADHPLWTLANCIISPHVGNTPEMAVPLLSERITTNVRHFAAGEELVGAISAELGY